jgi:hypothetical protein
MTDIHAIGEVFSPQKKKPAVSTSEQLISPFFLRDILPTRIRIQPTEINKDRLIRIHNNAGRNVRYRSDPASHENYTIVYKISVLKMKTTPAYGIPRKKDFATITVCNSFLINQSQKAAPINLDKSGNQVVIFKLWNIIKQKRLVFTLYMHKRTMSFQKTLIFIHMYNFTIPVLVVSFTSANFSMNLFSSASEENPSKI